MVNSKIYIGVHITANPYDDYLGSGLRLRRAIAKYGVESFTKEVLFIFNNSDDMFNKEKELVTSDFVSRRDVYNLKEGGNGGWDYINVNGLFKTEKWADAGKTNFQKCRDGYFEWLKTNDREKQNNKIKNNHASKKPGYVATFMGKKHTEKTKEKLRNSVQNRPKEKMSAYGCCWIHNKITLVPKRIKRIDLDFWISQNYVLGRVPK